jgi:hypothetical protein
VALLSAFSITDRTKASRPFGVRAAFFSKSIPFSASRFALATPEFSRRAERQPPEAHSNRGETECNSLNQNVFEDDFAGIRHIYDDVLGQPPWRRAGAGVAFVTIIGV